MSNGLEMMLSNEVEILQTENAQLRGKLSDREDDIRTEQLWVTHWKEECDKLQEQLAAAQAMIEQMREALDSKVSISDVLMEPHEDSCRIHDDALFCTCGAYDALRIKRAIAIHTNLDALLAASGKEKPVAWKAHHGSLAYSRESFSPSTRHLATPLYAAPVVQPDMVLVPREPTEAMLDAAMNRYKHVSPEARLHFFQMHRENFRCDYKAMIAAAEENESK